MFSGKLLTTTALLAAMGGGLVGCSGSGPFSMGPSKEEQTMMAAMAARADYPTTAPTDDRAVGAVLSDKSIQLLNFSDQMVPVSKVWINGIYVAQLNGIAGRGSTTIPKSSFYDRGGNMLAKGETRITKVQVETSDGFFTAKGPIDK